MHKLIICIVLAQAAWLSPAAQADADRDSLIEAWEVHIASLPSTEKFEKTGEGTYYLVDTDLPYDGELILQGALARSSGMPDDSSFSHMGMLEIELTEMPEERLASQLYYYWIADKVMLYYSTKSDTWVSQADYTAEFAGDYGIDSSLSFMSFMMRYGIWILLIALVIFVFRGAGKQMKKNRALMDETEAINAKARENVDRAQSMQDEVLAITRQSLELQAENNATLKKILDALNR